MSEEERVVTAKIPADLATQLDEISDRIERTRSWIIREALREWLAEEQRRHEMTLEGMADFDAGRFYSQEEIESFMEEKKQVRRKETDQKRDRG